MLCANKSETKVKRKRKNNCSPVHKRLFARTNTRITPRAHETQRFNHGGNLEFWQSCADVSLVTRNARNRLLRMQLNRSWKDYRC